MMQCSLNVFVLNARVRQGRHYNGDPRCIPQWLQMFTYRTSTLIQRQTGLNALVVAASGKIHDACSLAGRTATNSNRPGGKLVRSGESTGSASQGNTSPASARKVCTVYNLRIAEVSRRIEKLYCRVALGLLAVSTILVCHARGLMEKPFATCASGYGPYTCLT